MSSIDCIGNIAPGPAGTRTRIGPPVAIDTSMIGVEVGLIGRNGRLTRGTVSIVNLERLQVMTPAGPVDYFDCLVMESDAPISEPGDAGGLIYSLSDNVALGLVFAHDVLRDGRDVTYGIPLQPVMEILRATWS